MSDKPRVYRVCTVCDVRHVENCRTCYGFGLRGETPIAALEAELARGAGVEHTACPECGGTVWGVGSGIATPTP